MSKTDGKICCNCKHNNRIIGEDLYIKCHCDIDGHLIGETECFEDCCENWKKTKKIVIEG